MRTRRELTASYDLVATTGKMSVTELLRNADEWRRADGPLPGRSPRRLSTYAQAMTGSLLGTIVTAVLSWRLQVFWWRTAPDMRLMFLSPDEVIIAVDTHSLATTGRDVEGRFLPLYFNIQMQGEDRRGWFTPVIFYLSALFLKVLPPSELAVRLPTACLGILDVVPIFPWPDGLQGVSCFALAAAPDDGPLHFLLSRLGMDYLYPLPFILAWLLCLVAFVERERLPVLFAATTCLGIGFYSYIGSVVMMPLYLVSTFLVLWLKEKPVRFYAVATAGFCLPLLPLFGWLLAHPTAFFDTLQRYDLPGSSNPSVWQGVKIFLSPLNIDHYVSMYWNFFNPEFFHPCCQRVMPPLTHDRAPSAPGCLMPLGIVAAIRRWNEPMVPIVVLGFVTAPVAALLGNAEAASQRAAELLPFGVLLATYGMTYLWSARRSGVGRVAALCLIAPDYLQFGRFHSRYFLEIYRPDRLPGSETTFAARSKG